MGANLSEQCIADLMSCDHFGCQNLDRKSHTFLIANVSKFNPSLHVCESRLLTKFCQLQRSEGQHNGHSDTAMQRLSRISTGALQLRINQVECNPLITFRLFGDLVLEPRPKKKKKKKKNKQTRPARLLQQKMFLSPVQIFRDWPDRFLD